MIGSVEQTTWRTVAADVDGVPQPQKVNTLTCQLRAYFAYKAEAESWQAAMLELGFNGTLGMAAISYFGPTDSPSNCWSVQVERELSERQTFAEHTAAMVAAIALAEDCPQRASYTGHVDAMNLPRFGPVREDAELPWLGDIDRRADDDVEFCVEGDDL